MGPGATIGPFTYVQAKRLTLGAHASLKPLSFSRSHTIALGAYARNSPTCIVMGSMHSRSRLMVGDHSRLFPFCWLEPGEGIEIGNQVGVGGHTFIFSHGSWSDYLQGGPVKFAGVRIENDVWLPWRVTILAGTTVGRGSIVMAGSVVSKSVPADVIAGGSPAKVLKERGSNTASAEELTQRSREIVAQFFRYLQDDGCRRVRADASGDTLYRGDAMLTLRAPAESAGVPAAGGIWVSVQRSPSATERETALRQGLSAIDYPALRHHPAKARSAFPEFLEFFSQYGVRLYEGDAESTRLPAPTTQSEQLATPPN